MDTNWVHTGMLWAKLVIFYQFQSNYYVHRTQNMRNVITIVIACAWVPHRGRSAKLPQPLFRLFMWCHKIGVDKFSNIFGASRNIKWSRRHALISCWIKNMVLWPWMCFNFNRLIYWNPINLNSSFKEVLNSYLHQYRVSFWNFGDYHNFKDVEFWAHQCGWSPKRLLWI
jgi:hypothetical protein